MVIVQEIWKLQNTNTNKLYQQTNFTNICKYLEYIKQKKKPPTAQYKKQPKRRKMRKGQVQANHSRDNQKCSHIRKDERK